MKFLLKLVVVLMLVFVMLSYLENNIGDVKYEINRAIQKGVHGE